MTDARAADKPYTITTDSMVNALFTGDSQCCGRNLAIDFPQLVSRLAPVRVINTGVGGSNSDALLKPMTGGTVRIKKGESVLYGENVRWGMGPYPGMKVTVNGETYTMDHVVEHPKGKAELHLCEPARADYAGTDCSVEPGWEVRVARHRPDVVCLMYVNDGDMPPAKQANWREMIRRSREMGAVPVLMSPVPVTDSAHGGGHPDGNRRFAENARVVREIAQEQRCWFVDVFNLYRLLDPPFRGVVYDGIHPDTDGSTCIVNGLAWVFTQMGLMDARPFIKGWALQANPGPLPALMRSGLRPFRISQPDHPDPDHQGEEGFTLQAIRQNDEYGLIAARDGACLPVGQGLLFRCAPFLPGPANPESAGSRAGTGCGLSRDALARRSATAREGARPRSVALRLAGSGISDVQVWNAAGGRWSPLALKEADGWAQATIPENTMEDGVFHVLVPGGTGALLDALAVDVRDDGPPAPWRPRDVAPSEYVLSSDHLRPDNLILNPDFVKGNPDAAEPWTLSGPIPAHISGGSEIPWSGGWNGAGAARVNRPFRKALDHLSFPDEKDLGLIELDPSAPARPFDVVEVSASIKGNDGPYRLIQDLGGGRWQSKKRAKAAEPGLRGILFHNDGCGLVPGDSCVEVSGDGTASQRGSLAPNARALRASFFYRVYDPKALGTRDVPASCAQVKITFFDAGDRPLGPPWVIADLVCSYQWQKAEADHPVPEGAVAFELSVRSTSAAVVQYTGCYLGPAAMPESRE